MLLDYPEIIELNSSDNDGEETALILAFPGGHKNIVQLFMDHSGIDLNVRDNTGRTALMIASQRGREDIVRML